MKDMNPQAQEAKQSLQLCYIKIKVIYTHTYRSKKYRATKLKRRYGEKSKGKAWKHLHGSEN